MKSLFFSILLLSSSVYATELRKLNFSSKEKASITFNLIKKWKHEKKMLGLDHLYVFAHGKSRDLISIIFSPPGKVEFTMNREQEQKKYEQQKSKWIAERGGTVKSFNPLKTSVKGKHISYRFGMNYKIGARDIIEFSQYHFCDGRLVYIKFLGDNKFSYINDAQEEIAKSFTCVGL